MVLNGKSIDLLACEDDLEDAVLVKDDDLVIDDVVEYRDIPVSDPMVGDRSNLKFILPVKRMSIPQQVSIVGIFAAFVKPRLGGQKGMIEGEGVGIAGIREGIVPCGRLRFQALAKQDGQQQE